MNGLGRTALLLGAFFGACSVAAGAFGAHALREHLDAYHLQVWNTAAQYEMYHALALLLVAALVAREPQNESTSLKASVVCFATGIIIFSTTLYALALTGIKWLGAITPIGGLLLIVGWLCLIAYGTGRSRES